MNPKVTRFIIKASLGIAVSALIGTLIKTEHTVVEKLDEIWANKAASIES